MKKQHIAIYFLCTLFLVGCAGTQFVTLNTNFWSPGKSVGLLVIAPEASHYREGGQGLLDMAVTAGEKYKPALEKVKEAVAPKEKVEALFSDILKTKNKNFKIVEYAYDAKSFQRFQGKSGQKKYFKEDIRQLKTELNVDELMLVEFHHGILVNYYGFAELERKGFSKITTQIIDLNDNSLMYRKSHEVGVKIEGKWNENDEYTKVVSTVENAIENLLSNEKRLW